MITKATSTSINLCDTCQLHPATCSAGDLEYGTSVGSDNVIQCNSYLEKVLVINGMLSYINALKSLDKLLDAKEGTPEYLELERLTSLILVYEQEAYGIDFEDSDPLDIIDFLLEQRGLVKFDLVPIIGLEHVTNIFNHRQLDSSIIEPLARFFHISPDLLKP